MSTSSKDPAQPKVNKLMNFLKADESRFFFLATQPVGPALEVQSLNHQTTRKVS